MHQNRYKLAKALFVGGTPWHDSTEISGAVEEMVIAKMTGHSLIEIALLLLVCILWYHNQQQCRETKEWQKIVEEHCKR